MKRIINYTKNKGVYVFQEEGTHNKIKIDINEKKLLGKELYENFFANYNVEDTYAFIDKTTEKQKIDDKFCEQIFNKIKELFLNIETELKDRTLEEKNDK